MSAPALTGPHQTARGYTWGRKFREVPGVKFLGIHTAEGARDEMDLLRYWQTNSSGSSHAVIGQDGGYATAVPYADTAWTNPPLNEESDTVELCAFAKWTREEWLARPALLETLAAWIAWRCEVRGIPIVLLTAAQVRAGTPGIVMHRTVNEVYKKSSHWDPGYNLPWDVVLPRARAIQTGSPVTPPAGGGGTPAPVWRGAMGWRALKRGMTGADVKALQGYLNGFGAGLDEDGVFGDATDGAVRNWQTSQGLARDGQFGQASQNRAAVTKPGADPGLAQVEALQVALGARADRVWGADTDKRGHTVRMASTSKGRQFPNGVRYAQQVVGANDDGTWGPASRRRHDVVTANVQRALGVPATGTWDQATDNAYVALWRRYALAAK